MAGVDGEDPTFQGDDSTMRLASFADSMTIFRKYEEMGLKVHPLKNTASYGPKQVTEFLRVTYGRGQAFGLPLRMSTASIYKKPWAPREIYRSEGHCNISSQYDTWKTIQRRMHGNNKLCRAIMLLIRAQQCKFDSPVDYDALVHIMSCPQYGNAFYEPRLKA
jgi:hypothetical protein